MVAWKFMENKWYAREGGAARGGKGGMNVGS